MSDKKWFEKKDPSKYAEWQMLKSAEGLDYYYNTVTQETTWDKPDALKTEDELKAAGDWVWAPHDMHCYIPATVVGQNGGQTTVRAKTGETFNVPGTIKMQPLKPASLNRIVNDLVLLDDMSTPLILYNLKTRFEKGDIYTNIGTILISVNPYKSLGLYSPEKIYEYQYRGTKEVPPHVFNIAHSAYKGMADFGKAHSIIISGESGAGKTEATKQCLSYIAAIAGSELGVEKKVLQANPILEGFGNAKTCRNDNSSRFGKYMQLFFGKKNDINGSSTINYLLEKIRVVQQQPNERNFHAFYQLVKASSGAQKTKFQLATRCEDYEYLNKSGCINMSSINDEEDFKDVLGAMNDLGFSAGDQDDVFMTTSAVLALGNMKFAGGTLSKSTERKWAETAAKLIKVDVGKLEKVLTKRDLKIKGQATTTVNLDDKQASDTRHAMAKFIYGNMFDWIVQKVNKSMVAPAGRNLSIGILDIFGFEIFQNNSFEQLCINFTNEMLQQHFNHNTFKLEEQIYQEEGIQFKHVDFIDNQPVLDLITDKNGGILTILDEEIVVPKGSDQGFVDKMRQKHAKSSHFSSSFKVPMQFNVKHYAGHVTYDGTGFLEKNRDTLTDDLLELLTESGSPFVKGLFPAEQSSANKKASLSKQFQQQLKQLMFELHKTEPHYIRCVKPNSNKSSSEFDSRMSLEQLTYSGVFEAVAIRKQGFPFRLKHEIFLEHYRCIMPDPGAKYPNPRVGCQAIIDKMKLNATNTRMGHTQLLYRSDEHKSLELQRSIRVVALEMEEELKRLIAIQIKGYTEPQKESYFQKLSMAIEQADEFRLTSEIANKARAVLDVYIESRIDDGTKAKLQWAHDNVNEEALRAALVIVDKNGFKTKLCKECRRLLTRIERINEEMGTAALTLDEFHVEACIKAADEIKLSNEWLEYFRGLYHGPRLDYLTAQYDKAMENKNTDRAIRLDVKRKDIQMEAEAHTWGNLQAFPKLKAPADWAGQKFLGKKDILAANFLCWTGDRATGKAEKLHSTLCKYDNIVDKVRLKEVTHKATDCYKYILKYLGQRISKRETGVTRARQALESGLQTPEIRDEIFIQLIKATTNNPDPNAGSNGWDLMALCLLFFPPSAEFSNYLEFYLRKNAPSGKQKNQFTGWLRQRVLKGPAAELPTDAQLEQIETTLTGRSRGFSEPLPPGLPPWQDLLESYYASAQVDNKFRREIKPSMGQQAGAQVAKQLKSAAANNLPLPAAAAPAKKSPWTEMTDPDSGEPYYYNEETGESQWDKPADLMYGAVMGRAASMSRGW